MSGIIGVHAGAGIHSEASSPTYKKLCRDACRKANKILQDGGSAVDAVTSAIVVLENSPMTNAGFGSNLTWRGGVECDACVMDGHTLSWGGVGAIPGIPNPVTVAKDLCVRQNGPSLMMGRIPPCLLVGEGGRQWAEEAGITTVHPEAMISAKAARIFRHYKKKLCKAQQKRPDMLSALDTVGAVSIDSEGHIAAACSSGGIILKYPGRVGQAAMFGCGCWAQNGKDDCSSVATCTSGCGEYLTRTLLAREAALDLQSDRFTSTVLHETMVKKFLESPFLAGVAQSERLGGIIALKMNKGGFGEFLWAHTTESLCVAYMKCGDAKVKSHISRLPQGILPGTKVVVEGVGFQFTSEKTNSKSSCDME